MFSQFSIWEFLAGLGIFLLGMLMIEKSLSRLAGRSFKQFLKKHTNRPIKAILGGTAITAFLQSSSIVSLMVLAFVGAGIIELANAIGIIIGSNLGTTFTGWIVAYFGFQFDIESFALPFIAFGGLSMVFFSNKEKLNELGRFLTGLGFLFLGLEYMKSSIDLLAQEFDLSVYAMYGPYILSIVGFVLAALIQSSSAVMVITLSALNAGIIPLESAAAMVIGGDLGTTITTILGSLGGSPAKKRVALSHFSFNFITDVIALIFLFPLMHFVTDVLAIENALLSLVAFHSIFNLMGIIIFFPFLRMFARFLEKRFSEDPLNIAMHITSVPASVPEAAIEALRKEVGHLIYRVFYLHLSIFNINRAPFSSDRKFTQPIFDKTNIQQYQLIKELEGEIIAFYLDIQNQEMEHDNSIQLKQLIMATQYALTAAKGVKDISHNFKIFNRSVNENLLHLTGILKIHQEGFYFELFRRLNAEPSPYLFEGLTDLKKKSKEHYNTFLDFTYKKVKDHQLSDLDTSTLLNVNREIHSANKALIYAIKEISLDKVQAEDFDLTEG